MIQDKLIQYVSNRLDEPEAKEVRDWISESEENKKEFIRLKNAFALSGKRIKGLSVESDFQKLKRNMNFTGRNKTIKLFRELVKYAAVVVITLLIGYSASEFFSTETDNQISYNELIVPLGQISEFELSDGTHVWLNSGTRMKFPTEFNKEQREIFLEGEAYFKVASDKKHPFLVKSGKMITRVLGTEFNVSAYNDNSTIETTLIEGVVEVLDLEYQKKAQLETAQQFVFSKQDQKHSIRKVDIKPYEAWKKGELYFRDKTLAELKPKLERWYNVDIVFADERTKTHGFSGTVLKQLPFDQVLQFFQLMIPIDYRVEVKQGARNRVTIYSKE